jgi:hypothetical protein
MEAPKSERAVKILGRPDTATKLVEAIRTARSKGLSELRVDLNGRTVILREVAKAAK